MIENEISVVIDENNQKEKSFDQKEHEKLL